MVRDALQNQIGGETPLAPGDLSGAIDESLKSVITDADVRPLPARTTLVVREDAIITPSAQDLIRERSIELRVHARRPSEGKNRIIAIGSDHGGFEMKEELKQFLDELRCASRDFGTFSNDAVDYPDYAHAVARAVAEGV